MFPPCPIKSPFTVSSYVEEIKQPSLTESNTISRVVVFSIDAFRHDYFDKLELPTIEWLIEQGIKAEFCIPSNPSVTAVNHVSMITGNHPDEHGVLGNTLIGKILKLIHYLMMQLILIEIQILVYIF